MTGTSSSIVIIAGLFTGVRDGADILSMSLGGAFGWTDSVSAVIASRIAEEGTIVVIAAGNDVSIRYQHLQCLQPYSSFRAHMVRGMLPVLLPVSMLSLSAALKSEYRSGLL